MINTYIEEIDAKTYNYLKFIDLEYKNQNIVNNFPPIYGEMRKLFGCKTKYNLNSIDCEIAMKPNIGIYTPGVSLNKDLQNFLKIKHK